MVRSTCSKSTSGKVVSNFSAGLAGLESVTFRVFRIAVKRLRSVRYSRRARKTFGGSAPAGVRRSRSRSGADVGTGRAAPRATPSTMNWTALRLDPPGSVTNSTAAAWGAAGSSYWRRKTKAKFAGPAARLISKSNSETKPQS